MREKILRTAVVGLGRVGWRLHVPRVHDTDGFELCAVVDTNRERLEEAFQAYGIAGYTSIPDMLAEQKLDLIVIASPTHLHVEHAVYAMEAGVDVFLDKPMAKDMDQANILIEVQKRTGRKLMMFQPHRLYPNALAMKKVLDSGVLGEIYMYRRTSHVFARRNDWQTMTKYGGGTLSNTGPHFIDQALYILDAKPTNVYCNRFRVLCLGDAEDAVNINIETDKRTVININASFADAFGDDPWTIYGNCGTVRQMEDESGRQLVRARYIDPATLDKLELDDSLAAADRRYRPEDKLTWQVMDVYLDEMPKLSYYDFCYDYFALDSKPLVPLEQSIDVMRTMNEARLKSEIADFGLQK